MPKSLLWSYLLSLPRISLFGREQLQETFPLLIPLRLLEVMALLLVGTISFGTILSLPSILFWLGVFFMATEDQLQIRGFHLASVCQLCATPCSGESISHFFFQCSFAQQVWQWLASQFVTSLPFAGTLHTLWNAIASKGFKSQLRNIWLVACLHSFHLIWKVRNRLLFDNIRVSIHQALAACKAEILFICKLCPGYIGSLHD